MYTFNETQLQLFDVILVRFPGDVGSEEIRNICKSEFSHSIVYIGNHVFFEGVEPVVTLFSTYRYYFKDLKNIRVVRLKEEFRSKLNLTVAEAFIRSLAYCNYSKRLLYYILKQNLPQEYINIFKQQGKWIGGIVCSTLVSLPYYIGGVDITQKDDPYYADFMDLENPTLFDDVTTQTLVDVPHINDKYSFDYFSLQATGSIQEKQSEAVRQLNKIVQDLYTDLKANREKYLEIRIEDEFLQFTTWEDVYPNVMRWFKTSKGQEIDETIYQGIVKSGYNTLWFEDVHNNKTLYFPLYYFDQYQQVGFESIEHY